ncbi:MAG TPA: IS200/IS605 family transposase [Bacteroidales bacterium]|nr:IS200/IS605 family transposase [Bacteroidales bacterium]HRZ21030.1 IS200/IS605 family transposase [Bacteroidales bacterium]
MGYTKIWIHIVWTTKNRRPLLIKEVRSVIFDHIKQYALKKSIYIDSLNGHLEHIHCLVSMGSGQNVEEVLRLLKGESSHWINQSKLLKEKFEWQDEYFAVSVSESAVDRVRRYIKNQEEHHRKKSFTEEYQKFRKSYGFDRLVSG